ncbi:GNAT family N-acetyltransferase [Candidatus Uhrbacteria bacterium]|nr:GNAT family N-acetyltransferase [Candidatus Uhrbacteria bacterium]
MSNVRIRPFEESDKPILADLYVRCFAEPPWYEVFTPEEVMADIDAVRSYPESILFVAEEENRPIGAAWGFSIVRSASVFRLLSDAHDRHSFYHSELFVDPHARSRGVARQLVSHMLLEARDRGFNRGSVRTSVDQAIVQRLYLKGYSFTVIAEESVVSKKTIDGIETEQPDRRLIMTGWLPTKPWWNIGCGH